MKLRRRQWLVLAGAALAGCAGPRRIAPADAGIAAPRTWRDNVPAGPPLPSAWWELFGDAALTALVTDALAHSDDIALAALRVTEARAELGIAQSQRRPNLQGALEGGRSRGINPGFGIPEEQTAGQGLLSASFDVDLFGRLKAASAAAQAALLATDDARHTVMLGVAATVAASYFTLRALDARLQIVQDTLAVRQAEWHLAQRRYDAGYATALDVTRAEAALEGTRQLIPVLELGIATTENSLCILLGRPPGPVARGASLAALALPDVPVTLPSKLVRSRPDIAAAEARLAGTDHALDAARAAFLPDIRLAASTGYAGSTLIDASPIGLWSLGTSILAPIYDGGRLRAQQDGATARRDAAAFAYRKTVLQAFRDVENNLAATAKYRQQYESVARQRDIEAHAYQLAARRYREGYVNYLDQLDAQRNLLASELALVQARLDRLNAAVSLIQAVGGGWVR